MCVAIYERCLDAITPIPFLLPSPRHPPSPPLASTSLPYSALSSPPQYLEEFLLGRQLSLSGLGIITPPYAGMSLAAALESAAHGSSLVGPASIAAGLVSAVLVDGSGGWTGGGVCRRAHGRVR